MHCEQHAWKKLRKKHMTKKVTKTIFQTNGTFQGEKVSHFNHADTLESDVCLRTFMRQKRV